MLLQSFLSAGFHSSRPRPWLQSRAGAPFLSWSGDVPRIRTIKPEFWADEKMSELDPLNRLVFLGIISMADDCGRLLDNVKVIDAFIFPSTSDTCRDAVANLSRMCRLRRGTTKSGQKVIQIVNWERHQKVDKPNKLAALPELVDTEQDTTIRDTFANDSRHIRDQLATLPTTYDLRAGEESTPPPPHKKSESYKKLIPSHQAAVDRWAEYYFVTFSKRWHDTQCEAALMDAARQHLTAKLPEVVDFSITKNRKSWADPQDDFDKQRKNGSSHDRPTGGEAPIAPIPSFEETRAKLKGSRA